MKYDIALANRLREYLSKFPELSVEEKIMFRGITFMINDKMCISVSGVNLMCRFDPEMHDEVAEKTGFEPMVMKGKTLPGYCYVNLIGFKSKKDFEYWINLCLAFNEKAKSSKKKKTGTDKPKTVRNSTKKN